MLTEYKENQILEKFVRKCNFLCKKTYFIMFNKTFAKYVIPLNIIGFFFHSGLHNSSPPLKILKSFTAYINMR